MSSSDSDDAKYRTLCLLDDSRYYQEKILRGLGVPAEMLEGDTQYATSNIALRALTNTPEDPESRKVYMSSERELKHTQLSEVSLSSQACEKLLDTKQEELEQLRGEYRALAAELAEAKRALREIEARLDGIHEIAFRACYRAEPTNL